MPNHTSNKLTVTGAPEDIIAFIQKCNIEEQDLSFNAFIQCPTTIDHQRRAWGTKWDAYSVNVTRHDSSPLQALAAAALEEDTRTVSYFFDTAWCYPEPVIEAIFEQHPELTIEHCYIYEDGGGGVNGRDYAHTFHDDSEDCRNLVIELQGYDPWSTCSDCGESPIPDPRPGYKQCLDCIESEKERLEHCYGIMVPDEPA